jgi:hypothetical protein
MAWLEPIQPRLVVPHGALAEAFDHMPFLAEVTKASGYRRRRDTCLLRQFSERTRHTIHEDGEQQRMVRLSWCAYMLHLLRAA